MTQIDSKIVAVTVYPDRARVTRRGSARLESGLQKLEMPGLPLSLEPASLRAAARGSARARLLGVQTQRVFLEQAPVEQMRDLEAQLEAVQDELRRLETQIELVGKQRAALNALADQPAVYARGLAKGKLEMQAQLAMLDQLGEKASQYDRQSLELGAQKRELERRAQKIKNELDRYRGTQRREQLAAQVEVDIPQPGDLTVELTYVVTGASWQPLYDLRLVEADGGKPVLEVGYLAQVTQRSAEAWEQVALSLSTARPALASVLPELKPWYIQPVPPLPAAPAARLAYQEIAAAPVAMAKAVSEPRLGAVLEEVAAEQVEARVDASGAAVTYHISGPVSIPPDGTAHKATIARFSLEPRLDYLSAPKLAQAAYRRAQTSNASAYTLLPGVANLFAGDEFIGETHLDLVAPQGEIELYLGVDDRLKVERELKRREVDKRLIGGKRVLHFGYEIKAENMLPFPAKLSLHDQIPVARHEEIKVRLEMVEPKPKEHSELNELVWELTLASQEKKHIRFDFSVESPPGMEISGIV
jgi:uncharacterized protein (TIGR02231 family)